MHVAAVAEHVSPTQNLLSDIRSGRSLPSNRSFPNIDCIVEAVHVAESVFKGRFPKPEEKISWAAFGILGVRSGRTLASASCLGNSFRSRSIQSGVLTPHGSIKGSIVGEPLLVIHLDIDPETGSLSFATGLKPRNVCCLHSLMMLAQSASSTSRRGTQSSSLYPSSVCD